MSEEFCFICGHVEDGHDDYHRRSDGSVDHVFTAPPVQTEERRRDEDLEALARVEVVSLPPGVRLNDVMAQRDEAIRLCREARDERDSLGTQRAPGYKFNAKALAELTPDQLRLHVLMAEAEILRLRKFETEQAADAKIRADVAEAERDALREVMAHIERIASNYHGSENPSETVYRVGLAVVRQELLKALASEPGAPAAGEAVVLSQLGMNQPWPFRDAAQRLVDFVTQKLDDSYDGHGWEELQQARDVVRAALAIQPAEDAS